MSGRSSFWSGRPASGKTTVGTALAERWASPFRDTDADVEVVAGATVADLFVEYGEEHFRALEEQAVARRPGGARRGAGARRRGGDQRGDPRLLVAYGAAGGTVVWLDVDLASAANRVGLSRDRPLLGVNPRAMLRTMLEQRAPLYGEVATVTVATGGREPAEVVAEVLAALAARPGPAR